MPGRVADLDGENPDPDPTLEKQLDPDPIVKKKTGSESDP